MLDEADAEGIAMAAPGAEALADTEAELATGGGTSTSTVVFGAAVLLGQLKLKSEAEAARKVAVRKRKRAIAPPAALSHPPAHGQVFCSSGASKKRRRRQQNATIQRINARVELRCCSLLPNRILNVRTRATAKALPP